MGKYSQLTILKKTKARCHHACSKCGNEIISGEYYYREHIPDKFLHSLNNKKYCLSCYEEYQNKE